eukprot:1148704-Pelagomonas_calceolata.AAC.1
MQPAINLSKDLAEYAQSARSSLMGQRQATTRKGLFKGFIKAFRVSHESAMTTPTTGEKALRIAPGDFCWAVSFDVLSLWRGAVCAEQDQLICQLSPQLAQFKPPAP